MICDYKKYRREYMREWIKKDKNREKKKTSR